MTKKNFKTNNPAMLFISQHEETQQAQPVQPVQVNPVILPAQEVQAVKETKGKKDKDKKDKKDKKLPPVKMAFTQENLDYLEIKAQSEDLSITEYVNRLVKTDQTNQASIPKKAKKNKSEGNS